MRILGQVATSSASRVPVEATTYTEPTTGAQRSVKSASANDTAAGTGARKVKITFFTLVAGVMAGPFTETLALAGTVAVPTVSMSIALIEKIEVESVGSDGHSDGVISLYVDNAGASSVIGSIASGAPKTLWAHHYVPSDKQCALTDFAMNGTDSTVALVELDVLQYQTGLETAVTGPIGGEANAPKQLLMPDKHIVFGPARVRAYVTPGSTTGQTTTASFGALDIQGEIGR